MHAFDAAVTALTRAGLMVILNNHISAAMWCCSETDGNGLWYTKQYPQSEWLAMWVMLAKRYKRCHFYLDVAHPLSQITKRKPK